MIIKINNFRGDWSDASAKTATLREALLQQAMHNFLRTIIDVQLYTLRNAVFLRGLNSYESNEIPGCDYILAGRLYSIVDRDVPQHQRHGRACGIRLTEVTTDFVFKIKLTYFWDTLTL